MSRKIVWNSGSFLNAAGQKITNDSALVTLGFMIPFQLGKLVQVWDFESRLSTCKAIELQSDDDFKKKIIISNAATAFGLVSLIGGPILWVQLSGILGIPILLLGIGLLIWAFVVSRQGDRHQRIRLLIGLHEWGSSDPATWHETILRDVVDPEETFERNSFFDLAKELIANEDWSRAIWAARLSTALEDKKKGEKLTDKILDHEEIKEKLDRVLRRPSNRDKEFSAASPLQDWIECNPEDHVFQIT